MVDMEKDYNVLEWNATLANLRTMRFPEISISWISPYLTFVSFFFLINEQPTNWFWSHRRVQQDNPIFPYLNLLVSQNLSSILNCALRLKLV